MYANNYITLVLGASNKSHRYSKMALELLQKKGIKVVAIGSSESKVGEVKIQKYIPKDLHYIDTVSIYLNSSKLQQYKGTIIKLNPRRVIFNPGVNDPEFQIELSKNGIEVLNACTLVMLQTNQY